MEEKRSLLSGGRLGEAGARPALRQMMVKKEGTKRDAARRPNCRGRLAIESSGREAQALLTTKHTDTQTNAHTREEWHRRKKTLSRAGEGTAGARANRKAAAAAALCLNAAAAV